MKSEPAPLPLSDSDLLGIKSSCYDWIFPFFELEENSDLPKRFLGTCFAIGKGFYLTSSHNFEVFGQLRGEKKAQENFGASYSVTGLAVDLLTLRCAILKPSGRVLFVTATAGLVGHDVAFLVALDDDLELAPIRYKIRETPDSLGKVIHVGYRKDDFPNPFNPISSAVELKLYTSEGEVFDRHPIRRDSVLACYPCFESTATSRKGMSGGPVFDKSSKELIGINSRGFQPGSECASTVISWIGRALDEETGLELIQISTNEPKQTLREYSGCGFFDIL